MKAGYILIGAFSAGLFLSACQQPVNFQTEEFRLNDHFTWTVDLPMDWERLNEEQIREIEERGFTALEESSGVTVTPDHRTLFNIRKDELNSIYAAVEHFDTSGTVNYPAQQSFVLGLMTDTYTHKGMSFERSYGKETIDGISFKTLEITMFDSPRKDKVIFSQKIWSGLVSDQDLLINLNYDNDAVKESLSDRVRASRFLKNQPHN